MALDETSPCIACGKAIPADSETCPHCGMPQVLIGKKETGGQKSLGLKEEDVQNEKFRAEQFGQLRRRKGRRLLWKITAIVLFVLTVILIALNMLFS